MENTQTSSPKIKLDFKDSKYATGRRKKSVAKVWLKKGSGQFYVNGKLLNDYFPRANHVMQILRPFEIINQQTDYDVRSKVVGGGQTGQAGALVHGISRRQFKRTFTLSDDMVVNDAGFKDGMLTVKLEKIIPDEKKPRTIDIK